LGLVLCAGVVGYTLRQYARLLDRKVAAEEAAKAQAAAKGQPAPAASKADAARTDKELATLSERLSASPALRREVFRDWLKEAAPEGLASAVALLGAGTLDEVRADPECEEGLHALDAHLST